MGVYISLISGVCVCVCLRCQMRLPLDNWSGEGNNFGTADAV